VSDRIAKADDLPKRQAAIPSASTTAPVTLADALAAVTALRATVNAMLAALRSAGIVAP
jgi:hypothetical protein